MRILVLTALLIGLEISHAGAAQLEQSSCASGLRAARGADHLPSACRALGALRLGGSSTAMLTLLGRPDAQTTKEDGSRVSAWIFPRTLNHDLAAKPTPASSLSYGVMYVAERSGKIVGIRDDTSGLAPAFRFAGLKVGEKVAVADASLGAPTSISRARDFRSYSPLPLAIHVDENTQRIDGFEIGEKGDDLQGPSAEGAAVSDHSGLIRHLNLRFSPH